ncbi:MAG: hypothetical protein MK116_03270 [Phycisphaerales bacterium]|nr:hypothetical protein [Phycisphaerales bacterium]
MTAIIIVVFAVLLMVLLVIGLRGRVIPESPACAKCRYCVARITTSTCPECGADLAACGVLDGRRQPISRWIRVILVALVSLFLFGGYAELTDRYWRQFSESVFGRSETFSGRSTGHARPRADASSLKEVLVAYPDVSVVSSTLAASNSNRGNMLAPTGPWTPPQPLRLIVQSTEGIRHDFTIEPLDTAGDMTRWRVTEVMPLTADPGTVIIADPVTASSRDELPSMIMQQVTAVIPPRDGDDPGAAIAGDLVAKMIANMMQDDPDGSMSIGIRRDGVRASGVSSNIARRTSLRVPVHQLAVSTWFVFWLVVLVLVLIPGRRPQPWDPETSSSR